MIDKDLKATDFWSIYIKRDLERKFNGVLSESEKEGDTIKTLAMKNISLLIERICKMTGIKFSARAKKGFKIF